MLYIQYVFRFHTTWYVLHVAMLVLLIDYSKQCIGDTDSRF